MPLLYTPLITIFLTNPGSIPNLTFWCASNNLLNLNSMHVMVSYNKIACVCVLMKLKFSCFYPVLLCIWYIS